MSRPRIHVCVVPPLAFRASPPPLDDNFVNLVKTTTQAIVIALPELLCRIAGIYDDYSTSKNACMRLMFVVCFTLVGVLGFGMNRWERALRIPGCGASAVHARIPGLDGVRGVAWALTRAFRNSPWLVLPFTVMPTFSFRIVRLAAADPTR